MKYTSIVDYIIVGYGDDLFVIHWYLNRHVKAASVIFLNII